jgi:hypothetical protein
MIKHQYSLLLLPVSMNCFGMAAVAVMSIGR